MIKHLIIFSILITTIVYTQTIKVEISPQYVIGDGKSGKEYLFRLPKIIQSDSQNNIYVVDEKSYEIRKYDKTGKYIKSIGRVGNGPGEFKDIKNFIVDENDNLFIFDQLLSRLSIFDKSGKYLESKKISVALGGSNIIGKLNSNLFMAIKSGRFNNNVPENKIVIFGDDYNSIQTSFGHSSIFWKMENPFEVFMDKSNQLCSLPMGSDKVIISKAIYDGKIYTFIKNEGWKCKISQGRLFKNKSYEIYNYNEMQNIAKDKRGHWIGTQFKYNGVENIYAFLFWSHNAGIFKFKDKYILNFFTYRESGKTTFGVDVFDVMVIIWVIVN